ncbi:MAG: choloylglycine hydrolase family protein [Flavobacteriaceae bacterium]|nr:choloylglycine hydrolase family protein [Flavobacteriaceae bacterium]
MIKRFQLIIIISALILPFNSSRAGTEILVVAKDSSEVTLRSMEFGVALNSNLNIQPTCTEILVIAKDSSVVTVRSMEFGVALNSDLNIQPRGESFTSITPDSTPGMQWTNKYGYVYMSAMGYSVAIDGLNEAGLSFGGLYLPGYTVYQDVPKGEESKALWNLDFGLWVLGNFSTVEEVRTAVQSVYVCFLESFPIPSPLHFNVTDATGKSIIIEYTAKGLNIYDNTLGVLTNSPPYDWQTTNITNYLNLTPNNPEPTSFNGKTFIPVGQGAGFVGIPGDWTPPSRFIKSTLMSHNAIPPTDITEAVNLALHFINAVDIPLGVSRMITDGKKDYDYTQWVTIRDLTNRRYMFRTYDNLQVRSVDLNKLDLKDGAKKHVIKITGGDGIVDITPNQ